MAKSNVGLNALRKTSKHWRASVKAFLAANSKWLYASHGENLFFEWLVGDRHG